jgi:hypothetical protein
MVPFNTMTAAMMMCAIEMAHKACLLDKNMSNSAENIAPKALTKKVR